MITDLQRFAFNQARFAFYAVHTIERDEIRLGITFEQALDRIRATPLGQKYLANVSLDEMKREAREPDSLMDANTDLGKYTNGEFGGYVEDFVEL